MQNNIKTVKLSWRIIKENSAYIDFIAEYGGIEFYRIDGYKVEDVYVFATQSNSINRQYESLEEAKEAAQNHFDSLIYSLIEVKDD